MYWKRFVLILLVVTSLAHAAVTYAYDDAGRLLTVDYGNGAAITYSYDKAGNLISKTVTQASSTSAPKPAHDKAPEKKKDPPKAKQ